MDAELREMAARAGLRLVSVVTPAEVAEFAALVAEECAVLASGRGAEAIRELATRWRQGEGRTA